MIEYIATDHMDLDALTPFPGNARRGDVGRIAESLAVNGQYRSLVVRRTDSGSHVVLAGNHTLQALGRTGAGNARCEIVRCDDQTAVRINLADNRTGDLGGYDNEALDSLLASLDDLTGTGYTDADVAAMASPVPELGDFPEPTAGTANEQPRLDRTTDRECPSCGHRWYLDHNGTPVTVNGPRE